MSDVDKWYRDYWARHKARDVMYKTLRARCLSCEDRTDLNEYERVIFDRTRDAARLLDLWRRRQSAEAEVSGGGFSRSV